MSDWLTKIELPNDPMMVCIIAGLALSIIIGIPLIMIRRFIRRVKQRRQAQRRQKEAAPEPRRPKARHRKQVEVPKKPATPSRTHAAPSVGMRRWEAVGTDRVTGLEAQVIVDGRNVAEAKFRAFEQGLEVRDVRRLRTL